jgi:hypothetical protein
MVTGKKTFNHPKLKSEQYEQIDIHNLPHSLYLNS